MFKIRLLSAVLACVFVFQQVSASQIVLRSKYQDALDYLRLVEVIESQKNFEPEAKINRAEFVSLVLKEAGYDPSEMKKTIFRTPYQDVSRNVWYAPYVYIALENGLIEKGDYFYPQRELTRYEALKFVLTLEGIPTPLYTKPEDSFRDIPENSKLSAMVRKALELNLIMPESQDYFGIMHKITKGEVANMIYEYELRQMGQESLFESNEQTTQYSEIDSEVLVDVWDRIHQDYLFADEVNDEAILNAAIEAMVGALNDPFSTYMPPEEGSDYADSIEGQLEGIGAYLSVEDGKIIIVSPIQDSPAEKAGLKPNDQIIRVDDNSVEGLPLYEVVKMIKGPQDTQVDLTIMRKDKEINVEITRAKIEIKSVSLEFEDDIAVLSLNQFISRTSQEFDNAAEKILEENVEGIVFDLRNNPGGYLGVSVDVLGHFVQKGELAVSIDYPDVIFEQNSQGPADLAGIPLVVLVNGGSASAAEIVAGALQDYELATLVGETTYGKGTVQELTYYADGSNLKLTIAKWLTPEGRWVNASGIEPDVSITDKETTQKDEQMERAIKELK